MARKKKYAPKSFESCGASNDISANIYMSMATHPAFHALTAKQQVLYMYCKLQYYGEKNSSKPSGYQEQNFFTMNRAKYVTLYGLYSDNKRSAFIRDMSALIANGFIDCVYQGETARKKSVYAFSNRWQAYGTENFVMPKQYMNGSMLKRELKEGK